MSLEPALGGYLVRELASRGWPTTAWSGSRAGRVFGTDLHPVDLAKPEQVTAAFQAARPTAVLHAAAMASVADCFRDPQRAAQVNTQGTALLAELAARSGARLLQVSSDLVFDGRQGHYREQDAPSPLSIYGRTKAEAETPVLATPRGVVVRVSLLYGPSLSGKPSFFDQQTAALREQKPVTLFTDEWRTPLDLPTAARALVNILDSDYVGLLHLGGPERMSRYEMGLRLAASLGANPAAIIGAEQQSVPMTEPRPRDVSLDSSHWRTLFPNEAWPNLEAALAEMVALP
jgi:dTDP-4-dehydrorhamnose reductase